MAKYKDFKSALSFLKQYGFEYQQPSKSEKEYYKTAKTPTLKAIATCTKSGKTISFFEVNIYDEEENLIAKANLSYCYIEK